MVGTIDFHALQIWPSVAPHNFMLPYTTTRGMDTHYFSQGYSLFYR
jgi:hypothetical protein